MALPRQGVINLPSRQINDFVQKGNRKKIELIAEPGRGRVNEYSVMIVIDCSLPHVRRWHY